MISAKNEQFVSTGIMTGISEWKLNLTLQNPFLVRLKMQGHLLLLKWRKGKYNHCNRGKADRPQSRAAN